MKNFAAKTRKTDHPYEVWTSYDGTWTWRVLKKWHVDDGKPYARWLCDVHSPFVPEGELGDVYVADIKNHATLTFRDRQYAGQAGLPIEGVN